MADNAVVLDVTVDFVKRLQQADESLGRMIKTVDNLSSSFDKLANGGLSKFTSMLSQMTADVDKTAQTKIGDMGIKETEKVVTASAEVITEATFKVRQAIQELKKQPQYNADDDMLSQLKAQYAEYLEILQKAQDKATEFRVQQRMGDIKGSMPVEWGREYDKVLELIDLASQKMSSLSALISNMEGTNDRVWGKMISDIGKVNIELARMSKMYASDELNGRKQMPIGAIDLDKDQYSDVGDMLVQMRQRMAEYVQMLEAARQRTRELNLEKLKSLKSGQWRDGYNEELKQVISTSETLQQKIQALSSFLGQLDRGGESVFGNWVKNIGQADIELVKLNDDYRKWEEESARAADASNRAKSNNKAYQAEWDERQKIWRDGFDKIHAIEVEHAAVENQRAKESVEAYKKELNEKEKFYYKWIEKTHQADVNRGKIDNDRAKSSIEAYKTAIAEEEKYNREREAYYQQWIDKTYQEEVSKARAKYKELLSEQEKLNRSMSEYDALTTKYDVPQNSKYAFDAGTIKQEQKRVNDELMQLENDYYEELKDLHQANVVDRAQASIREAKKELQERKRLEDEALHKSRTTYDGAMAYSKTTNSINEQIQAMKYLKEARDKLDKSTMTEEEYKTKVKELTDEYNRQKGEVDKLTGKLDEFKNKQKNIINYADQMKRAFVNMFSIHAIRGYINQLVRVRSELELQQRALTAIVKNKAQANKVWQQTLQLAVKSPFSVKEMITSTKQLAAYRIETEKLVETNKMLSDISAGVGVEMSRLILAFGQVKAANYLRGTELRQFSEAGVNILDELAKHFSILEGTTVSVGEVFDRVSKRMVTFADVETVLRNVTSAGGAFYRMQEIQSETLRGKISNLKDALDLMFNDIGRANDTVLKGMVDMSRMLIQHWETLATILTGIIVIWTANKFGDSIAQFLGGTREVLSSWTKLKKVFSDAGSKLKEVFSTGKIGSLSLSGLGATAAVAALADIASDIASYHGALKQVNAELQNIARSASEVAVNFDKAFKRGDLSAAKTQLAQLATLLKNEFDVDLLPLGALQDMDLDAVEDEFDRLTYLLEDLSSQYRLSAKEMEQAKLSDTWWARMTILDEVLSGNWDDLDFTDLYQSPATILKAAFGTLESSLEKYSNTADKTFQHIKDETSIIANEIVKSGAKLSAEQEKALNDLSEGKRRDETQLQYLKRMNEAYATLSPILDELDEQLEEAGVNADKSQRKLRRLFDGRVYKKAMKEAQGTMDELEDGIKGLSKEDKEFKLKAIIDKMALDQSWDEVKRDLYYKAANERFNVYIVPTLDTPPPKELAEWQTNFNEEFKKSQAGRFKELTAEDDAGKSQKDLLSELRAKYEANLNMLERLKVANKNAYPTYTIKEYEQILADIRAQGLWLGEDFAKKENTGGKSIEDLYGERLKVIMDMHKEYKALQKTFSDTESSATVITKFADAFETAFKGIEDFSIVDVLFESEGGVEQALQRLLNTLPATAKEARFAIERQLAEIRGEVRLEAKLASDKDLKQEVEDMFSGYELWLDVQELDIPTDWAKDLFNIDTTSLDELKNNLKLLKPAFVGQDMLDEYNTYLKKVDEMETKAQQERLKKYLEYSRNSIGERAKIKMEELRQLAEIEETFRVREGDSAETIAIKNSGREAAISSVKEQTQQALNKFDWDEFQKSETFISLFDDLDGASSTLINHAINKLEEFKEQWRDMPHEEMKSIVEKINQLRGALYESENPWGAYKDIKAERSKETRTDDELRVDNIKQEEKLDMMNKELAIWEQAATFMREGNQEAAIALDYGDGRLGIENMTLEQMEAQSDSLKQQIKDGKNQIAVNTNNINLTKQGARQLLRQADALKKCDKMAQDLYGAFRDMAEVLGADESNPAVIMADTGMQMASNVMQTIALSKELKAASEDATAFGAAMNTAMGIIGWIVMAVQLLTMALKAVFEIHDNRLQEQIDAIAKRVDVLNYKLERLEEQLEKVYNTDQLEQYGESFKETTEQMINDYNAMIALEQDKKKSDEAQIEQWEEERLEAMKRLNEYEEELFTTATDGILDNTLSVARDFVDAWYDSFQETGDGLAGLQENFNEMFQNLVKQQVATAFVGDFVNGIKNELKKYINEEDYELSDAEARAWKAYVDEKLPALSAALETVFESIGDITDTSAGGLSELGKGIQGVTETTAQVIEAYLNSVRFYVADSNLHIKSLRDMFESSDITRNPILNELREHTRIIELIDSRLASVINTDSGGSYLRVQ